MVDRMIDDVKAHEIVNVRAVMAEAERDALRIQVAQWLAANGPGGWINELRKDSERLRFVISCSRAFGADISGMHSWSTQYHQYVRGASMVEAIDNGIAAQKAWK